jgi:hypothetical protein
MTMALILALLVLISDGGVASAVSTETPASEGVAGERGTEAEDTPTAAKSAPQAAPPLPTERLPAGSPVSFPIDI